MNNPRFLTRIIGDSLISILTYMVLSSVSGFLSDALLVQRTLKFKILTLDIHTLTHAGYVLWPITHPTKFTFFALGIWVFFTLYLYWMLYSVTTDSRRKYRQRHGYASHGTSRWQENGEVRKHYLSDPKGILLGAYHHKPTHDNVPYFPPSNSSLTLQPSKAKGPTYAVHPFESRLNQNYIVFAPPGFGKTTTVVLPNVFNLGVQGLSMVVTDPKGEIYELTSSFLSEKGYNVVVLDHMDFKFGNTFNALDFITEPEQYMELANMYMGATRNESDKRDFWEESAQELFAALIGFVHEAYGSTASMTDVYRLVPKVNNPDWIRSLFEHNDVLGTPYMLLDDALAGASSEKTMASIVKHLGTKLQLFALPKIQSHSRATDFDLSTLGRKKTVVYLRISDEHSTFAPLTSMFWAVLFRTLYAEARKHGGILPVPVVPLLDEMGNVGRIPDFGQKLTTMRSRGIFPIMIWHDYPQLEEKYGVKLAATILSNCATKILVACGGLETANKFSEMIGDTTIETQSRRENLGLGQASNVGTSSFTARRLMNASELMGMDLHLSLVLQTSRAPVLLNKVQFEHWNARLPRARFDDLPTYSPDSPVERSYSSGELVPQTDVDEVAASQATTVSSTADLIMQNFGEGSVQ